MTTRLTLDIVVTPQKTLVRPFHNLDFKYKQYGRSYNYDRILSRYVTDHGYRLKSYTEVSIAGAKRHYSLEVEVLSPNSSLEKKVNKTQKKGLDSNLEVY